jgi:hypothetical protein
MNKPALDDLFGLSRQVAIITGFTKGIGLGRRRTRWSARVLGW